MTVLRGRAHDEPFRTIADALPAEIVRALNEAAMWGTRLRKEWADVHTRA